MLRSAIYGVVVVVGSRKEERGREKEGRKLMRVRGASSEGDITHDRVTSEESEDLSRGLATRVRYEKERRAAQRVR